MKTKASVTFLVLILLQFHFVGKAQPAVQDSILIKYIDDLNRKIDKAVVAKDLKFLNQHYGEDFVFTHGTGLIDSKKSWLENIQKSKGFASRLHDSTIVELHKGIAIVTGKLTVGRLEPAKDGTTKYSLRYVRVFALRKKNWEMISHRTTSEWHH
ncbi:nuclear transport factor 2 family protein [Chryseolinea sp. H1M3-3]|uniref:nuclear transport factor 2 family protein n=1 Tax=Chryseolinea sp. H1M3-3 TaxID=3034144 RepID=UPI0023EDFCAF|nr:nuclear transport factor 2 family protein [Chryseolinea sp. H1M3-3]